MDLQDQPSICGTTAIAETELQEFRLQRKAGAITNTLYYQKGVS